MDTATILLISRGIHIYTHFHGPTNKPSYPGGDSFPLRVWGKKSGETAFRSCFLRRDLGCFFLPNILHFSPCWLTKAAPRQRSTTSNPDTTILRLEDLLMGMHLQQQDRVCLAIICLPIATIVQQGM